MRETVSERTAAFAKQMRREPTDAERRLWRALRDRRLQGVKFRRQVPLGPFIVDFLCLEQRLIIEADGSQHAESAADEERDTWILGEGYRIKRFTNREVFQEEESVLATIASLCGLTW